MFKLIQTSDTRSDCTASYDVQLDKEYTARELFETVLTQEADEWGAFYIMVRSKNLFWQNPSCEYKYGSRVGPSWANILTRYGDRKVARVEADGGWTRMDYYIWLDAREGSPVESAKPTEKEENEAMIHLDVREYCHGCPEFEPEVHKVTFDFAGTDARVTCEHSGRCANIFLHIKKQSEGKEGPDK